MPMTAVNRKPRFSKSWNIFAQRVLKENLRLTIIALTSTDSPASWYECIVQENGTTEKTKTIHPYQLAHLLVLLNFTGRLFVPEPTKGSY